MAYNSKRHAQNAADTAALAGDLAKIRGNNWNDTVDIARARAASNGYKNDGTTSVVEVYLCNDAKATCTALPASAKPQEYIEVKITSQLSAAYPACN